MKIEGDYTFTASREIIWSMLLDPDMLCKAISGCTHLDQLGSRQYDLTMHINRGPLVGQYSGIVDLRDVVEYKSLHITVVGSGPNGLIQAHGHISLVDVGEKQIRLAYQGELMLDNNVALQTTRLVQTTANAQLRKFFKALETQIQIQTNVYTTYISSESFLETAVIGQRQKSTRTIDTRTKLREIRRNRRLLVFAAIVFLLNLLALIGILVSSRTLIEWVRDYFAQQAAVEINRERKMEINDE